MRQWAPANYRELQGLHHWRIWLCPTATPTTTRLGSLHQLWANGGLEIRLCHEGTQDPVDVDLALLPVPAGCISPIARHWKTGDQKGCISSGKMSYSLARGFSVI